MQTKRLYARAHGVVADGETLNTTILQTLIDQLAASGGGVLVLDGPGRYLCGTLFLRDNLTLHLEGGATLYGSPRIEDYAKMAHGHNKDRQPYHLLVAENARNVVIEGQGCIDGNGEAFWQAAERNADGSIREPQWILAKEEKVSPLIECVRCQNLTIRDVTVKTGGGWNIHGFDCNRFRIEGVKIDCELFSPNSDGIDLTGCHDVMISNCYIRTCDDAIVLKTLLESRTCERITVTNCVLETACVALKLGATESYRDIRDVCFSNCVVHRSNRAFALYTMAGGSYTNIVINNITSNSQAPFVLSRPIHLMATNTRCPEGVPGGCIRNVIVSNFIAETQGRILMHAEGDCQIQYVRLRDVLLDYPYVEDPEPYARASKSAQFPSYRSGSQAGSARAAIVAENVDHLVVEGLQISWPDENGSVPEAWRAPRRIANGSNEVFCPSYQQPVPCPFHAVWLSGTTDTYIETRGLTAVGGTEVVQRGGQG